MHAVERSPKRGHIEIGQSKGRQGMVDGKIFKGATDFKGEGNAHPCSTHNEPWYVHGSLTPSYVHVVVNSR